MSTLAWIVSGGVAMSAIALVGTATMLLSETMQQRLVRPLVAFAAGSLLGGALLHMLLRFAAGNFLYIAASDLVPEVNRHHDLRVGVLHFLAFAAGAGLLAALRLLLGS